MKKAKQIKIKKYGTLDIDIPDKPFIGYKKVRLRDINDVSIGTAILKLQILGDVVAGKWDHSLSSGPYNYDHKLRTSKFKVLEVVHIEFRYYNEGDIVRMSSSHDTRGGKWLTYKVGKIITRKLDTSDVACASGLHFFLTKAQALAYSL